MAEQSTWLLNFKRDVYSQTGEDGVIERILATLPRNDHWCVEFGAWDGVQFSNTRHLIEARDYAAVLIEASAAKFALLQQTYAANARVIGLHARVGYGADDSLDALLADHPVPVDFDLLSIDVDGNDFHLWKAISRYRPKLVVIEFNPTIATEVRFVQPADPAVNQGASLRALVDLGHEKGYELVAALHHNAFFVDAQYFPLLQISDNRPEILRTDLRSITYVFCGFDGTLFLDGCRYLVWHRMPLLESRIQHLPRYLRKYPSNYTRLERIAAKVYSAWTSPLPLRERLAAMMRR